MKKFITRSTVMILGSLASIVSAFAQAKDANTILTGAQTQLTSIATNIINLISIIGAIVGVVMLAPNLLKYLKGDPSSNDALIKVGAGLLIFVVILQIIRVTMLPSA